MGRHYRKAVGGLVVYDITKATSFENAERWVKDLKANAEPNIVIMLVGNKVDACEDNPSIRQVSHEDGEKFAARQGLLFKEASAFQDFNVKNAFEELLQRIYDDERKGNDFVVERQNKNVVLLPEAKTATSVNCCLGT
eukprot:TRINITY_DN7007_c0_g1_i10.p1 TRINITY_DN7007_c0_g1~~TRINITY_DN7007_c0_g1_i10.p1  ORF type:complete len:138 (-),score=48.14 TRINITY_DN7007_c0_g1_i10:155-568(-)